MTDQDKPGDKNSPQEAWLRLRGCMKDIFEAYGGGEAYLRQEREDFNRGMERREALIAEAMGLSTNGTESPKE